MVGTWGMRGKGAGARKLLTAWQHGGCQPAADDSGVPHQLAPRLQILVRHGQPALLRDVEAVEVGGPHLRGRAGGSCALELSMSALDASV